MTKVLDRSLTFIEPDALPDSADGLYCIGMLADQFGITYRTIRFYCESGLISAVTDVGQARVFDLRNAQRLSLVLKAKALGMSLSEIKVLIVDRPRGRRGPLIAISSERIEREIESIERRRTEMLAQLQRLIGGRQEAPSHVALVTDRARSA